MRTFDRASHVTAGEEEGGTVEEVRYPMGVASERTGIPATVLRSWESRHEAVVPERTAGGHRLYSPDDLERLTLLRRLVEHEHRISEIARLPTPRLRAMLGRRTPGAAARRIVEAARAMDLDALDAQLRRAALEWGFEEVVEGVLLPLLGTLASSDSGLVAHLRYQAAERLSGFLEWLLGALRPPDAAGVVVVRAVAVAPAARSLLDEPAARLVAVVAAQEGWDARVLGRELPAGELEDAIRPMNAALVIWTGVSLLLAGGEGTSGDEGLELSEARSEARRVGELRATTLLVTGAGSGEGPVKPPERVGGIAALRGRLREELAKVSR